MQRILTECQTELNQWIITEPPSLGEFSQYHQRSIGIILNFSRGIASV